jgi:hypothetical protein
MQGIRNSRILTRIVLGWFGLLLVASALAPLIQPRSVVSWQAVCSSTGIFKPLDTDSEQDRGEPHHKMVCPLCTGIAGLTLTADPIWFAELAGSDHMPQWRTASQHSVAVAAPPLPSRGPPASEFLLL